MNKINLILSNIFEIWWCDMWVILMSNYALVGILVLRFVIPYASTKVNNHAIKLCHDLLELLPMLHLNFYELWTCSSASLISFWVWCALVFFKKCSLASLRFIWELVKFWRNSLLLHLNYFERKKICYAHDLHLYLFELMKSNTWKLVPKW